jgi:hypothetical protein
MPTPAVRVEVAAPPRDRVPPGRRVARELVAAAGLVAVLAVLAGAVAPDAALRSDLAAAAAALRVLPQSASPDDVASALRAAFHGRSVTVDVASFPVAVEVTVHAVDRQSCVAAAAVRRLEGKVAVELAGYGAPADCGDDNAMTWRLMP